jgi:RHS repeat-associated protein
MEKPTKSLKHYTYALALAVFVLLPQTGHCFYNSGSGKWLNRDPLQEEAGPNTSLFVANDAITRVDILGLLNASVTVSYSGHGSIEVGPNADQYLAIDNDINGQVPLSVGTSKPAGAITARLDDSFYATIVASTISSAFSPPKSLQLSTDLNGVIKACCSCPFTKVQAAWSVVATLRGGTGSAHASFDGNEVIARPTVPSSSKSGTLEKL